MKTNISTVGRNLTLSRGATVNSTNTEVVNFLSDPLATNALTNIRASGHIYKNLVGQSFSADLEDIYSYTNHYIHHSLRFLNEEAERELASVEESTAKTSLSIDISAINIREVNSIRIHDTSISDPDEYLEIFIQADSWENAVLYINSYFMNSSYVKPYIVKLDGTTFTIENMYNIASLDKLRIIDFNESASKYIKYTKDSEDGLDYLEFSTGISIIQPNISAGAIPETLTEIGNFAFRDSHDQELSAFHSEVDDSGTVKISLRANSTKEVATEEIDPETGEPITETVPTQAEFSLFIDKEGNAWVECPEPDENANSNEVATTKWVRKVTAGGMQYKGPFDASAGNYNALSNSYKGWMYVITGDGIIDGIDWKIGDFLVIDEDGAAAVTKIDNTESDDLVRLDAIQTLTNKTLTSPALTGTPTTVTPVTGNRSAQIANTQFIGNEITALKNEDYFVKVGNVDQQVDGVKHFLKVIERDLQNYSPSSAANSTDYIMNIYDSSNDSNLAMQSYVSREATDELIRLKTSVYNPNHNVTDSAAYDLVYTDNGKYYLEYTGDADLDLPEGDVTNKIPTTNWVVNEIIARINSEQAGIATTTTAGLVKPDGTTITITSDGTISATTSATPWGNITGTLADQLDLKAALDAKEDTISDLASIRSGATAGATALQPEDVEEYTAAEIETLWNSL